MDSRQHEPARFDLRDLTRGETTIAFLLMAHLLKQTMVRGGSDPDLKSLKADLIHDAKSAVMSGPDVQDEIAVLDTVLDLIEIASERAEQSLANGTRSPAVLPGSKAHRRWAQ